MPRNAPHRYPRTARANEVLIEIVAEELGRLSDPRLELVTVTGAEASSDLAYATIYYSALDGVGHELTDAEVQATAAALHKAAPHLRRELGRQVRWRNTPALTFKLDPSVAAGQRIEELLRGIHAHDSGSESETEAGTTAGVDES